MLTNRHFNGKCRENATNNQNQTDGYQKEG